MSIVDKAGEAAVSKTPHVLSALRRIRLLIIGICSCTKNTVKRALRLTAN